MIGTSNNNMIIPSVEVTDVDDANNNNIMTPNGPDAVVDDMPQIHNYASSLDHEPTNVLCLSNNTINLFEIPISALGAKTRDRLSINLNTIKVLLSELGVPRDWRGVHHCFELKRTLGDFQSKGGNYMNLLLTDWEIEHRETATLGALRDFIGQIDRWDVVDDTTELFVEDAKAYLEKQSKMRNGCRSNEPVEHVQIESVRRYYDAFVLATDKDVEYVVKIIENMELKGLSVCHKDDLLAGTFEHQAIIDVISQHCERVIVVFSQAFIKSPEQVFFATLAQAIGVKRCKLTVIPCLYDDIDKSELPITFQYYHVLRYNPESRYSNFWDRLEMSIKSAPNVIINHTPRPKITITEIPSRPALMPAPLQPPQPQTASIEPATDSRTPQPMPRKRKDKSGSPKSSRSFKSSLKMSKAPKISLPSTPNSLKPFYPPSPKLRVASSMTNLTADYPSGKENEHSRSTSSLNSPVFKKNIWQKIFRSPNSSSAIKLSVESDSGMGMEKGKKKKSWYRKRFRTKNHAMAKEV